MKHRLSEFLLAWLLLCIGFAVAISALVGWAVLTMSHPGVGIGIAVVIFAGHIAWEKTS